MKPHAALKASKEGQRERHNLKRPYFNICFILQSTKRESLPCERLYPPHTGSLTPPYNGLGSPLSSLQLLTAPVSRRGYLVGSGIKAWLLASSPSQPLLQRNEITPPFWILTMQRGSSSYKHRMEIELSRDICRGPWSRSAHHGRLSGILDRNTASSFC